jgi:hypothetical protein
MDDLLLRVPAVTWRHPVVPAPAPASVEDLRIRVLTNSNWAAGLRAGVPEESALFRKMLGQSYENAEFDLDHGYHYNPNRGVSTCALFAGEILSMSGVEVPWKGHWYKSGTAVSRIFDWGSHEKLLVSKPEQGDICLIGTGMQEHVAIFVGLYNDGDSGEPLVWTVDGGQVDTEHKDEFGVPKQAFRHVHRDYSARGSTVNFGSRPLIYNLSLRKIFEKGLCGPGEVAVYQ